MIALALLEGMKVRLSLGREVRVASFLTVTVGKEMPDKLGVILEKRDAILFVWDRLWSVRFEPPGGA